jgi:hypothetical protein
VSEAAVRPTPWRIAVPMLCGLMLAGATREAVAFRPFDGTDAAVAEPGEVEVELGPAGYLHEGSQRTLIAPALRVNYGLAEGWEAVLEGQAAHGLSAGGRGSGLVGNGAFLKAVLRQGSLQGEPGPSIAAEGGVLLPGLNGEPGRGGSIAGVISQRWPWLTAHLNLVAAVTRRQQADGFVSVIIEGPAMWTVRPVAELAHERDSGGGRTISALLGLIWRIRDNLAVDVALRGARIDDHAAKELRAGLTFALPTR